MTEAKKTPTKKAPAKKITSMKLKDGEPRKAGRPTIFDQERSEALLNAIRLGTPLQVACDFAGISRETLRLWRQRGNRALAGDPRRLSPIDRKFAAFIVALDKAVAQAGVQAQRTIHTLMSQDVRSATPEQQRIAMSAAQFFLTHRLPDYYTTKVSTELTGKDGGPIEMALTAEKAWEIVRAIQNGKSIEVTDDEE